MSTDPDKAVYDLTPVGRFIVLISVILASTCYTATILVATTLLPQMQGGLSATQDEISWVMTFNILATARRHPHDGVAGSPVWPAHDDDVVPRGVHGRDFHVRRRAIARVAGLLARDASGLGAPLIPLSQTLLLDSYPRSRHSFVLSLYGMSNIVGPVLGPMFGGYIGETLGWQWGFYMVLPVSVVAWILFRFFLPPDTPSDRNLRLDWIGFLSLSAAIAGVQLVLSRGQRLDWYDSTEIWISTFVAACAFYVFLTHSFTSKALTSTSACFAIATIRSDASS